MKRNPHQTLDTKVLQSCLAKHDCPVVGGKEGEATLREKEGKKALTARPFIKNQPEKSSPQTIKKKESS